MGKDAQFSRDSQPQVRSSSKMIIFIASHKIGRFLARLFPAAEGFRATPPHNAEVSFSRSASPRCSVCVWTHCRCERCRATRSNALDSCSPPSFRSITKSKKKEKQTVFILFFLFFSSLPSVNKCPLQKSVFLQLHHGKLDRVQGWNKCVCPLPPFLPPPSLPEFFFFFYWITVLLFPHRPPATSASLRTNSSSTKPRMFSQQVSPSTSRTSAPRRQTSC